MFSADSSKVLRFRLTDQAFLEPSSIRLHMTIQNLTEDGAGQGVTLTPIAPRSRCLPELVCSWQVSL